MKTIFKFIIVFYFSFIIILTNKLLSLSEKAFLPMQWEILFNGFLAVYTTFSAGLIIFSIIIISSSSWEYSSEKQYLYKTFSSNRTNILYSLVPLILSGISFQYNLMMYAGAFVLISIAAYGFILLQRNILNEKKRND